MVDREVRIELAWRHEKPDGDPLVSVADGRGRSNTAPPMVGLRTAADEASAALADQRSGRVAALDALHALTPSEKTYTMTLWGAARAWSEQDSCRYTVAQRVHSGAFATHRTFGRH